MELRKRNLIPKLYAKGCLKMDESTKKRLEQKQIRETEADYGISLTEYNYGNQLRISYLDIINYVYEQTRKGLGLVIVKEKFLQEVIDPKINELNIDLSNMEIDIDMKTELEKYNYDEVK
jgi:hypothetical protein